MENQFRTSMECFQARIKEFREDDETRWKYTEKELQRQWRILKEAGGSDEQFKEGLKKAGIDVGVLEKESKRDVEKQKRLFEELRKIEAPPRRRGRKERILLDQSVFRPPYDINTLIYPPAQDAWGNTEDCGFNLGLGEINVKDEATGDGWGIMATASPPPAACTLLFYYFPPRAGELTVEPHVDFQGDVVLSAHDHWYTSTWADLDMKLHFDLFQHYWDGEATATILNEHHQNINTAFWVDDHRVMSKTLSVSAHDPVWIKLTVTHQCDAHSSHAHVAYDFRTGSDRRIRVEYIRIHMPGMRLVALP
jgi:hypothetical protein